MTETAVIALGREALITVLLVAGPMIGLGLLVGLVISIFQATTQIQEQTLTFVPKIVAVLVAGVVFGPWMLRTMIEFSERLLSRAHEFIR
ncbi:MAG: flagellar biosynthesis protein FliQ [Clostridia bacterium]|nr:flagellar biosynthetic protein FliQ [Bacillota bacterium]MBO2520333.1 flagellar biosynthetic protein FliQ [Bacillota bacterium]